MDTTETILLADDDDNDALLLEMAFAKAGVDQKLTRVKDGAELIQYLNGEGDYTDHARFPLPCLLLLDLKMPYKNGFEVLEWIREQPTHKHLIVAVLTASKAETDTRKAYHLGANSYLVKPTTMAGLETLARRVKEYWLDLNLNLHY